MNANLYNTKDYEDKSNRTLGENKPNQTQFYVKDGSGDGGKDRGWVDFVMNRLENNCSPRPIT